MAGVCGEGILWLFCVVVSNIRWIISLRFGMVILLYRLFRISCCCY